MNKSTLYKTGLNGFAKVIKPDVNTETEKYNIFSYKYLAIILKKRRAVKFISGMWCK